MSAPPNLQFYIDICTEQGNSLKDIDLTVMPQSNNFIGTKLVYPFYRFCKWNDIT